MRPRSLTALASCLLWSLVGGCQDHSVGQATDATLPDGAGPDAGPLSCDPDPGGLGCTEIVFVAQQTAFTQAEAAAGIDFAWELVVPDPLAEVYPNNPDPGCCGVGTGPLMAQETVSGNQQYYCDCDHGLCDPTPCQNMEALSLSPGRTTFAFGWPGVNWYGPSDTGNPYGAPFPRGEYVVRIQATGQWRPTPGGALQTYVVVGELAIELIDGCGDRPAAEAALWSCTGGVGEGGLCVDLTIDASGLPTSWVPEWPLEPAVESCLDDALMNDCYPSLAGTTEQICIYGV